MKTVTIALLMLFTATMAFAETPGEILNRQGNDLARKGKLREAIVFYDRATAIEPDYAEPFYNRGKARLNLEDFKGAIADFDVAIRLTPDNADTYNNRGIAKKKFGDLKGAIDDYTDALRLDPQLHGVYYNRGVACYEAGDMSSAIADLTIASEKNIPNAVDALRQIQAKRK